MHGGRCVLASSALLVFVALSATCFSSAARLRKLDGLAAALTKTKGEDDEQIDNYINRQSEAFEKSADQGRTHDEDGEGSSSSSKSKKKSAEHDEDGEGSSSSSKSKKKSAEQGRTHSKSIRETKNPSASVEKNAKVEEKIAKAPPMKSASEIQAEALGLAGYAENENPADDVEFGIADQPNLIDPTGDKSRKTGPDPELLAWEKTDDLVRQMDSNGLREKGVYQEEPMGLQEQQQRQIAMMQQQQQQQMAMMQQQQQQDRQQQPMQMAQAQYQRQQQQQAPFPAGAMQQQMQQLMQ